MFCFNCFSPCRLLKDYESADTELLIYATSLINKTLSGLSDQDSFYDESDFLEQQGIEGVIQRYMSRSGTDLDLLDQLQLYEAVLKWVSRKLCIFPSLPHPHRMSIHSNVLFKFCYLFCVQIWRRWIRRYSIARQFRSKNIEVSIDKCRWHRSIRTTKITTS